MQRALPAASRLDCTAGFLTPQTASADSAADGPQALPPWLPAIAVLFATLLAFSQLRAATALVAEIRPDLIWAWWLVVGAAGLSVSRVRYAGLGRMGTVFARASAVFLILYFATEPFVLPRPGLPADHLAVLFHQKGRWVGLALAAAGLWRPAFVFASAMVLWLMRDLNPAMTGLYYSNLDIRNAVEAIVFVLIGLMLVAAAAPTRLRSALRFDDPATLSRARMTVLAASLGGHFSSYFLSAIAKLSLSGGPLSWLLDNRFEHIVLGALERGSFPWAFSPVMTEAIYTTLAWFAVPLNIAAFGLQAAALVAPIRLRWLIGLTALYDLFHLTVYLVAGLLFWKWMALNTIFLVTLLALRSEQWDRWAKGVCLVFVLLGGLWFRIAFLAWYETPAFASIFIQAETEGGETYRVPPAYFGMGSYQISQGWLHFPEQTRHFPFCVWGSCHDYESVLARRRCELPKDPTAMAQKPFPLSKVQAYIAAHHRQMRGRLDDEGRVNYLLYPHHHMPSLFTGDRFYNLDKRRIARYRLVIESVCLSLENGRLQRDVRMRDSFPVFEVPK